MHAKTIVISALAVMLAGAGTAPASAQDQFRTRLSSVAMDLLTRDKVAGVGEARATLTGNKLEVSGDFRDLPSPATDAHLLLGVASGARGPVIIDLQASKGTSGTLQGTATLNKAQVAALWAGRIYVQINSEKAPDGNLWGWLWPADGQLRR